MTTNPARPTLILMVGLPYSGKSTLARRLASALGAPIVSPDEIRKAIHGHRFHSPAEPMVWYTASVMVQALFAAGHAMVILDATNISHKRRDQWRSERWDLRFVEVATRVGVCRERALARNDSYILPVIDRMHRERQPLDAGEERFILPDFARAAMGELDDDEDDDPDATPLEPIEVPHGNDSPPGAADARGAGPAPARG